MSSSAKKLRCADRLALSLVATVGPVMSDRIINCYCLPYSVVIRDLFHINNECHCRCPVCSVIRSCYLQSGRLTIFACNVDTMETRFSYCVYRYYLAFITSSYLFRLQKHYYAAYLMLITQHLYIVLISYVFRLVNYWFIIYFKLCISCKLLHYIYSEHIYEFNYLLTNILDILMFTLINYILSYKLALILMLLFIIKNV